MKGLAWLVWLVAPVRAEPLSLSAVLTSVERHAPKLAAMDAKLEEAEAKALGSRGAFDPLLESKVLDVATGPYPRVHSDTALSVQTPWGPAVSAGYRVGTGSLPSYYGAYETLDLGELRVEVAAPLLADLGMTAARAAQLVADQHVSAARFERDQTRQQLYGKAADAYWKWVAAGEKLALSLEMLSLAEARQASLVRQVDEGALPAMEAIDNERVVWSRRAELAVAERELAQSAIALSIYYRDDNAQPRVPVPSALPERVRQPVAITRTEEVLIAQARGARPDLAVMDALLTAARWEQRRARSARLPELDGQLMWSEDRGVGNPKLATPELILGASLKVPLAMRKARGELGRATAAIARLSSEKRLLEDTVAAEVRLIHQARGHALARWEAEVGAVQRAARVAELERRALELGSSDIFKVTKREETVAKERKAEIDARTELARLDARLRSVTAEWTSPRAD